MKKIILVEDDTAIREAFSIALDARLYEIVAYETGNPILDGEILQPDLFMLDKNIAGIDGLDLCRFIKTSDRYSNTPVIILSANPHIKDLALDAGADDAIAKPFTLKTLREIIAKNTSQQ